MWLLLLLLFSTLSGTIKSRHVLHFHGTYVHHWWSQSLNLSLTNESDSKPERVTIFIVCLIDEKVLNIVIATHDCAVDILTSGLSMARFSLLRSKLNAGDLSFRLVGEMARIMMINKLEPWLEQCNWYCYPTWHVLYTLLIDTLPNRILWGLSWSLNYLNCCFVIFL